MQREKEGDKEKGEGLLIVGDQAGESATYLLWNAEVSVFPRVIPNACVM